MCNERLKIFTGFHRLIIILHNVCSFILSFLFTFIVCSWISSRIQSSLTHTKNTERREIKNKNWQFHIHMWAQFSTIMLYVCYITQIGASWLFNNHAEPFQVLETPLSKFWFVKKLVYFILDLKVKELIL